MKYLILPHLFLVFALYGQKPIAQLPEELVESSALLYLNKEFYSINDSGNEPKIYVFNDKGEIQHTCFIENVSNVDWEALCFDEKYIYIADIGNNLNERKDLGIYRVERGEVRTASSIRAEITRFNYQQQVAFPPERNALYYDAESLVKRNDSLFIFTKNRTEPFDGIAKVYYVPSNFESQTETKAIYLYDLNLPATNWMEESITDAQVCGDHLFILTYAKVYDFKWIGSQFVAQGIYYFDSFTQKEGLAISKRFIYLTDEREAITTKINKLYKLKR
jgi:hypothetical protein